MMKICNFTSSECLYPSGRCANDEVVRRRCTVFSSLHTYSWLKSDRWFSVRGCRSRAIAIGRTIGAFGLPYSKDSNDIFRSVTILSYTICYFMYIQLTREDSAQYAIVLMSMVPNYWSVQRMDTITPAVRDVKHGSIYLQPLYPQ